MTEPHDLEKTLPEELGFTEETEKSGQELVYNLISAGKGRSTVLRKILTARGFTVQQRGYLCYYYGAVEIMAAQQQLRDDAQARSKIMRANAPTVALLS